MVEELISFSALDNIHEITCVSLMGVSIDDVRCQLLSNSHSCKTSNSVLPNLLNSSPASNKGRVDIVETEKEDHPEILREEDVGTVDIKAIHFQLRRLLKDSNFSDGIVLTAIPEQKSKVMFTFENDVTKLFSPVSSRSGGKVKRSSSARTEKDREGGSKRPSLARNISHEPPRNADDRSSLRNLDMEENPFDAAPQPKLLRQRSITKDKPEEILHQRSKDRIHSRHSIGYIMFECGLEDISITAVRRLGYKDKNPDITLQPENVEISVNETQQKTKTEMETSSSSKNSQRKGQGTTSQGTVFKGKTQGPVTKPTIHLPNKLSPAVPSPGVKSKLEMDPLDVGPPVELYTSSNSVHSWDSRISIPSDSGELGETNLLVGDASSGVLHLKTIWFNFAAPPPLPIKRKADFTK